MSDLISRQALCEYALNQKDKCVTPNDIMRFPPAQPQRKKGKWILETFQIRCSQCSKLFSDNLFPSNYCPNCGADMRGESDE